MENQVIDIAKKRKTVLMDAIEGEKTQAGHEEVIEEETQTIVGSEEMEMNISHILEKIERFTQQEDPKDGLYLILLTFVSELLEAGRTMFKDLSTEFEERMIAIHQEKIEKWQDVIKDLRSLDASNEEAGAHLHNAQYLLQSIHVDS